MAILYTNDKNRIEAHQAWCKLIVALKYAEVSPTKPKPVKTAVSTRMEK